MSNESFYTDHWRDIEAERIARYEEMFVFRPQQEVLLQPFDLAEGQTVVDFGCGPGFMAMEIGRRVGATGSVIGLDINAEFVDRASTRAEAAGVKQVQFQHLPGATIPLGDNSADRLLCKNVLEYVPDCPATLKEQRRVLKPGGLIEIIDSDWGFVIVEPWGKAVTDAFFEAARGAFNEFYIGRRLNGFLLEAGFSEVKVRVTASADTVGGGMNVLTNMASYIRNFGTMPQEQLDQQLEVLREAIAAGTFLFVLPQFVVTGRK